MKSVIVCGLMLAAALAAPDRNLSQVNLRRGRQVLANGQSNGQALRNGAVLRKVPRRGRQELNPAFAVPAAPIQPAFAFRAAPLPLVHHQHAPAQFQILQPSPSPLPFAAPLQFNALAPLQFNAPPPLRFNAPAPLQFNAPAPLRFNAPAPAPAPLQRLVPVLAPAPSPFVAGVRASEQATLEYGAPATIAPEVRATVEQYGAPSEPEVVVVRNGYLGPEPEDVVEVRDSYLPAEEEEEIVETRDNYGSPSEPIVAIRDGYLAAEPSQVVAVRAEPAYSVVRTVAVVKSDIALAKPIAILRSVYNPPAETSVFDYSFESENGIKQEAVGSLRIVDDVEVSVMKGSYSYIGPDGNDYLVEWYADETGFHATAPHLPKSVEPNHPEVAAAVRAQIAFAAEEDATAAASSRSSSYRAAEDDLEQYGLASYN